MVFTPEVRLGRERISRVGIDKSATYGVPQLLASARRELVVATILELRRAKQLLAHFVDMLVEEALKHDGVSVVEGRVQPFVVTIFRGRVFLRNRQLNGKALRA